MATLTTYKNSIIIYGNDFTLEEFRTMVHPYLTIRLCYDIEYTDIDGCDGCIYRAVPYLCIDEYITRILADEHAHHIYITPHRKGVKR